MLSMLYYMDSSTVATSTAPWPPEAGGHQALLVAALTRAIPLRCSDKALGDRRLRSHARRSRPNWRSQMLGGVLVIADFPAVRSERVKVHVPQV